MTPPRTSLPPVACVLALVLVLTACDGDPGDPPEEARAMDPAVGAVLAAGADRLADRLAEEDDCGAIDEAELLYAHSRDGAEIGTVPLEVAREVGDVAAALTRDLTCAPEASDDDEDEDDEQEPDTTSEPAPSGGGTTGGGGDGSGGVSSGGGSGGGSDGKGNQGKGNGGKGKGK